MDRISELPDVIIHDILSALPRKEAARTTILSKAWFQAWQTYPRPPALDLEFDQRLLSKEKLQPRAESDRVFFKFMDESMEEFVRAKFWMKSFSFSAFQVSSESHKSLLKKWTELAAGHPFEELKIHIIDQVTPKKDWILPASVLCAASLKTLSLKGCKLVSPLPVVKFSSLRKLYLKPVLLDDREIHSLFASCPCIEDLTLKRCRGLRNIKLSGLQYLRRFNCSYLRPSADIVFPSTLVDLKLKDMDITDQFLCNLLANSPRIEKLVLSQCAKLEELKISSPWLLSLKIRHCFNFVKAEIDAPNLQNFAFRGSILLSFTLTSPLCSADLYISRGVSSGEWIQFLSSSLQLKELILRLNQIDIFKRFIGNSPCTTGIWKLEHLRLSVRSSPKCYRGLLDSLVPADQRQLLL